VRVRLGVHEGVNEGSGEAVNEGVHVIEGVNVAGTNGVKDTVLVGVGVGVRVKVGVMVTVLVTRVGVGVKVGEAGVADRVNVAVAEGVRSDGLGARTIAIQPMQ
jgi:hypothetical protein